MIADNQSITCFTVEQNLNAVENWCLTCWIQLNGPKTGIVPINLNVSLPIFKVRRGKCKVRYETKTLGLIVDDSVLFEKHAEKITARCECR